MQGLNIMYWNANGIKSKKQELLIFLKEQNIDIALINETHLRGTDKLSLYPFIVYRKDRSDRAGGGVLVAIKSNIKHSANINSPHNKNLEATGVTIHTNTHNIQLHAIYSPPGAPIDENELDLIFNNNSDPVIAAGDFNAHNLIWNGRTTCSKGRILEQYTVNRNINILAPSEPTHYSHRGSHTIIDLALIKNVNQSCNISASHDLSSDHKPVLLTISGNRYQDTFLKKIVVWPHFRRIIKFENNDINSVQELEENAAKFEHTVQSAIQMSTKTVNILNNSQIGADIKSLIKQKRHAKKQYFRTLCPSDKRTLNNINNRLQRLLTSHFNQEWEDKLEQINDNSKPWKIVRGLCKKRSSIPTLVDNNSTIFATDSEKANAFSEKLVTQFSLNPSINPLFDTQFEKHINTAVRQHLTSPDNDVISAINSTDIEEIINELNVKKAPGLDNISNLALKHLPQSAKNVLVNIVNGMFQFRHFPSNWKVSKIVMIHKPNKHTHLLDSYRPISLLSCVSKVAERIIYSKFLPIVNKLNFIPNEQHGFRQNHSTTHQTTRLTESVINNFNRGLLTGMVFLDASKAFDKIWHAGLIYKLIKFKIPLSYIKLLNSYLSNRKYQVSIKDSLSNIRNIQSGVPQGSILGPLLYIIYTADIPKDKNTKLYLYADDTAIFAQGNLTKSITCKIQTHLDKITNWSNRWKILFNPDKSESIIFTRKKFILPHGSIQLYNNNIAWKNDIKYLGIHFDKRLNFKKHISQIISKTKRIKAALYPLLNTKSKLNSFNKLTIYKSIIRSNLTHGAPTWITADKNSLKRLDRIQNITLRQIINARWYVPNKTIQNDLKIPSLETFINNICSRYFSKAQTHENPIINDVSTYNVNLNSISKHKKPQLALSARLNKQT